MAEKRMISKSISISEKVNSLPDVFDMLLFTWLIPHSDDFGRLMGEPTKVKALVIPLLMKSVKEVSESLQRLHDAGIIVWYDGISEKFPESTGKYIKIVNFEAHQSGLHKRTKSRFPEVPGSSWKVQELPGQEKRTEEKRTEENGINTTSLSVFSAFEKEGFGTISYSIKEELESLESEYTAEWVISAMKESVIQGKRMLSYVKGILKRWKANGRDSHDSRGSSVVGKTGKAARMVDPELESRRIEIARNKWIAEGNDPNDFISA